MAGQQNSWSISSWRHLHPTPATAGIILLVSPYTPGWPACPAPLPGLGWALVHLSGTRRLIKPPRKQGQPAGAEEGAALGHVWPQGFSGPCSNNAPHPASPPTKLGSGVPDPTGCEYMHACVCVFVCVSLHPSGMGSLFNSPVAGGTGKGHQGKSHFGSRSGFSKSYSQPWKIDGPHRPSSLGVGLQFYLCPLSSLLLCKDPLWLSSPQVL